MSLVGSEVNVSMEDSPPKMRFAPLPEVGDTVTTDTTYLLFEEPEEEEVQDLHPPVSPPRAAEALFFGSDLSTQSISATFLAEQIHIQFKSPRSDVSANTEDFCSVSDFHSTVSDVGRQSFLTAVQSTEEDQLPPATIQESPFSQDALAQDLHINPERTVPKEIFEDSIMSQPTTTTNNDDADHVDPAVHTYQTAKGIWAWGKDQIVVSTFLGIAEGVAGKVVEVVAGASLTTVDENVEKKLHGLDDGLLNPAIAALVAVLLGCADKTHSIIDPVIMTLLKPLGMLKSKPENPEVTPKVTS